MLSVTERRKPVRGENDHGTEMDKGEMIKDEVMGVAGGARGQRRARKKKARKEMIFFFLLKRKEKGGKGKKTGLG